MLSASLFARVMVTMTDFYKCLSSRFTRWVVENDFLSSNFVVLDIGVQGGHHPRWNHLGPRLELYGFDALGEEVAALRQANDNPNFHYVEMAIGDSDGTQPFFVTESRWTSSFYRPPPSGNNRLGGPDDGVLERPVVTKRIDTLIADGDIPKPDYIKMDVEGHEPKVIVGGETLLRDGTVLAVESESGFTAFPDAPLSHFALISEPMHGLGYYLYNIGLLHATKPPMAAGRPRIGPAGEVSFLPIGRPQTIDVLFCRDLLLEDWTAVTRPDIGDRLTKMAIILELYNLNDCAIELLRFAAEDSRLCEALRFSVDDAIDRLIPVEEGPPATGDILTDTQSPLRMDYATYQKLSVQRESQAMPLAVMQPDGAITVDDGPGAPIVAAAANPGLADHSSGPMDKPEITGDRVPINAANRPSFAARLLSRLRLAGRAVLPDGNEMPINKDILGWVDHAEIGSGIISLAGWAADGKSGRGVDRVRVFADGRCVAEVEPTLDRADVTAILATTKALRSGFEIALPKRILGQVEGLTLRVFAESKDGAGELHYAAGYPFRTDDDPGQQIIRAGAFIDRLLADLDRQARAGAVPPASRTARFEFDRELDSLVRLDGHVPTFTDTSGKRRVDPAKLPREGMAVIVTFGQSNAANHGDARYSPKHEFFNFDFTSGEIYVAADPLIGASGDLGNVATRLGDKLLGRNIFKSVLFAPLALGGSTVFEWSPEGFAHRRILLAVQRLREHGINPTHFLWHQGESDAAIGTDKAAYENSFHRMIQSLRDHGVYAPIFVSVASRCGNDGSEAVRAAQRAVVDPFLNVFAGPDTDSLGSKYRFDDCHFSELGLEAHADLWLNVLRKAAATTM